MRFKQSPRSCTRHTVLGPAVPTGKDTGSEPWRPLVCPSTAGEADPKHVEVQPCKVSRAVTRAVRVRGWGWGVQGSEEPRPQGRHRASLTQLPQNTENPPTPGRLLPDTSSHLPISQSVPWEEELCPDSEMGPRRRGLSGSRLLLLSLPLSRLMAAPSLPLAGSGCITYLPDADLPAAAGGSLR